MRSESEMISQLQNWGTKNHNIQAIVLTSSRANQNSKTDLLSDYDVELYVKDTKPFISDESWIEDFGIPIVRWPLHPQATFDVNWITQLIIYMDNVRIDFQITMQNQIISSNLDNGYKVIVDKERITHKFPKPSFSSYLIKVPTSEEFEEKINSFWWDIVYVAKGLWRDEINYAKAMMEGMIRHEIMLPLINWLIGSRNNWEVNTGIFGKKIMEYLDGSLLNQYIKTFAGADIQENWQGLFSTLEFTRTIGKEVAQTLSYSYPEKTDHDVTTHINWIYSSNRNK